MKILEGMDRKNILLEFMANDKKDAISRLAVQLQENNQLTDLESFIQAVLYREGETTTGVGNGIAVPHGKSSAVIESTVIFAKLTEPLDWDSIDGQPVDMIFMLAIADSDKTDGHLKLLANLASKLMDEEFVQQLRTTTDYDELLELISKEKDEYDD